MTGMRMIDGSAAHRLHLTMHPVPRSQRLRFRWENTRKAENSDLRASTRSQCRLTLRPLAAAAPFGVHSAITLVDPASSPSPTHPTCDIKRMDNEFELKKNKNKQTYTRKWVFARAKKERKRIQRRVRKQPVAACAHIPACTPNVHTSLCAAPRPSTSTPTFPKPQC